MKFRSSPESSNDDTRERIIKVLASFLNCEEKDMEAEMYKVYRINFSFARARNIPRDMLVHFVRKKTRDQVLQ